MIGIGLISATANSDLGNDLENIKFLLAARYGGKPSAALNYPKSEIQPGLDFFVYTSSMRGYFKDLPTHRAVSLFKVIAPAERPNWDSKDEKWFIVQRKEDGAVRAMPASLISSWSIDFQRQLDLKPGDLAVIRDGLPWQTALAGRVVKILAINDPIGISKVRYVVYNGNEKQARDLMIPNAFLLQPDFVRPEGLYARLQELKSSIAPQPLKIITQNDFDWINLNLSRQSLHVPLDFSETSIGYLQLGRAIIDHPEFKAADFKTRINFLAKYTRSLLQTRFHTLDDLRNNEFNLKFSDLLLHGRGVCQEIAIWMALLLREAGYKPFYWMAAKDGEGHAWLELTENSKTYLIDLPNGVFAEKGSLRGQPAPLADYYFGSDKVRNIFSVKPRFRDYCGLILSEVRKKSSRF